MHRFAETEPIGSADAAALLGVHRSTLTRWVQAGKIVPILRSAGVTIFDRADVLALTVDSGLPALSPVAPAVSSPHETAGVSVFADTA